MKRTGGRIRRPGAPYPEQSTRQRQRQRAARYQNYTNPLTGHTTHGLKPGRERGLLPSAS